MQGGHLVHMQFLPCYQKRQYHIRNPPPTFPLLYTLYKSVTNVFPFPNTSLFSNLQLHRKGRRKQQYRIIIKTKYPFLFG